MWRERSPPQTNLSLGTLADATELTAAEGCREGCAAGVINNRRKSSLLKLDLQGVLFGTKAADYAIIPSLSGICLLLFRRCKRVGKNL